VSIHAAFRFALVLLLAAAPSVRAAVSSVWFRVLEEDFASDPSPLWSYIGVTNASGLPLLRHDIATQRLHVEWDQANYFAASGDPYLISNSVFSAPLGRALTDDDTFRFGATLRVAPGTIPDTTEFYQIACFGLYGAPPELARADRAQSDNFSGNAALIRDASNLMEFNYFINNESFGFNPYIQGTLIGAMPEAELTNTSYFVTGGGADPLFHNTDMGAGNYLPTDTNLFVEVTYFGAATGVMARRVYTAIYTEAERTNLLSVNGVPLYYWTQPATGRTFRLDYAAFLNYASINFTVFYGGSTPDGAGAGSFDDLYVDLEVAEGDLSLAAPAADGHVFWWASTPGQSYSVVGTTNLHSGAWTTVAVVQAASERTGYTNDLAGGMEFLRLEFEEEP